MSKKNTFSLAIHGGAGVIDKEELSKAERSAIVKDLHASLEAGETVLRNGGSAIEAVCAAVRSLEDSANFNAGKGAVYSRSGKHYLEASVMEGKEHRAGALSNSKHIKNPVDMAKILMERNDIVMLDGEGVDQMAKDYNLPLVENDWFDTPFRAQQWELAKKYAADQTFLDHSNFKKGTVGAVAIDQNGLVAAATSTGGMTNKIDGRIGDTALIGCGTYADNKTCAVSCTGTGEYFIRAVVAATVSHLMEYGGLTFEEAAQKAIDKQADLGGDGGLIAIDSQGKITMPYNSEGMYRGYVTADEKKVYIWNQPE
ncbi:isoaspartyl peptidase/L-asparaginase family protein [Robertkochia aurantiaca]|uniref:isoaspartyl peptidase/L-asparaginase family protein n=1 Tax=Robertkochia aurantiaca TaxID=2873700 RepID=UPI001CCA60B9|nr:isoaspartyl peptidase/L-asparaginase [Robertkochia sp. 3YJGBD-33]